MRNGRWLEPLCLAPFLIFWMSCNDGNTGDDDVSTSSPSPTAFPGDIDGDGFTTDQGDCDDEDPSIHPAASETPYDGIDQDCADGDLVDVDGDGHDALLAGGDDCDDDDDDVYPGAIELAYDQVDQDCDGEDLVDRDQDGYDAEEAGGNDCDDDDLDIHPGAEDVCGNGLDEDCSGYALECSSVDGDGDGVSPIDGDCDDTNDDQYPGADEDPAGTGNGDGIDNDCDGDIDEGTLRFDDDGDGYTEAGTGAGTVDCDDTDASIHPDADETCGDGVDQDCDGSDLTCDAVDDDGDGFSEADGDCDDADDDQYPGADEDPAGTGYGDGIDNDCDGDADEGTLRFDDDGDGRAETQGDCDDADPSVYTGAKDVPYDGVDQDCSGADLTDVDQDGHASTAVSGGDDCVDTDAAIYPGRTEVPYDGVDQDCSGADLTDVDKDGYASTQVSGGTDCNDDDASIHPGATETPADGVDQDCSGADVADADGDGHASTAVSGGDDCNDDDASIHPGAAETPYDGVDQDCSGADLTDVDGDGYASTAVTGAGGPDPSDCDDADASIHPNATERCDGVDNDCDGVTDTDATELATWYADKDGDTYGDPAAATTSCAKPSGYVTDATDCDDTRASVNPAATEACNGLDDDCDKAIDEGLTSTYYRDADKDGYGDASTSIQACTAPSGYVADATDCRDSNDTIHPGAIETCDGVDQDCDGSIDEGVGNTYYRDADGDLYGDPKTTTTACTAPSGYVQNNTDCNDGSATVHPNATETCNGLDDDCDAATDEGVKSTFYKDGDGDGFGVSGSTTQACTVPSGYAAVAGDCDDVKATVYPGATETCNDVDDDCDGTKDEGVKSTFYADADGDGYGNPSVSTQACTAPSGYASATGDCDDTRKTVYPGATETCNGLDDDCDTSIDEGVKSTFYKDADGDGYGNASITTTACSAPSGYVSDGTDCNDANASIYPGKTESYNGIDDDCDGQVDEGVALPKSCNEIKQANSSASSGTYTIDTDGTGSEAPVEVYCDMSTDGGGWTYFVWKDLMAYWSFDDSSPTTADWGSYGGTLQSASQSTEVVNTGLGKSLSFANNDAGRMDLSSNLKLTTATSIVFWGRPVACENNRIPILFSDESSYLADLYYEGSAYLSGTTVFHTSTPRCTEYLNTWSHHVYVDDGAEFRVYRNGSRVTPVTYNYRTLNGMQINRFGSRPGFGTNGLYGQFDDVAVFQRALTSSEISKLYNEAKNNGRAIRWK